MGILLLTKVVFCVMIGFFGAIMLGVILIPLFKKYNIKQTISIFVKQHESKNGIPTMGGLIFILPTIISLFILIIFKKISFNQELGMALFVFIGYSLIGFIDDMISIKSHKNEGLTVNMKLFLQVLLSLCFFYFYLKNGGTTRLESTLLHFKIEMGWFYGVFILFVLVGSSNAVNLTDGLDGLAGGLAAIAFISYSLVAFIMGFQSLGLFIILLVGSLIGFLFFNVNPAKIFMGDAGSLSLGALMGVVAILTHKELTLFGVAFLFVVETLSVIIQTIWLILFKKKLFLMTPLHHHFEKLGYSESDIVKVFWIIGLSLTMLGIYYGVWL